MNATKELTRAAAPPRPKPARMGPADVVRVGGSGLRSRPMRVFLSALGIAIGIAAMVGVVGISSSSTADLNRRLAALGTNLLTVSPGQSFSGAAAHLPDASLSMISNIEGVESVSAVGRTDAKVYRNDHIPEAQTGGISVLAARLDLPRTIGLTMAAGTWLNAGTARYPAVVIGADAAQALGVSTPGVQVWLGARWFTVVGILDPNQLAPELDSAALVGWDAAMTHLGFDGHPTTVYARARKDDGAGSWAIQHIQAPDVAQRLADRCREIFGSDPLFVSEIGPVIGTHVGPGLLGVGGMPPALLDGLRQAS